jgi:hypothetical protein
MRPYVDIGNSRCSWRHNLSGSELRDIGEFTTENILRWLRISKQPFDHLGFDPLRDSSLTLVGFHAVCGDKDLRWETKEPWTPYDGIPVVYGNNPPVVYDTIHPDE